MTENREPKVCASCQTVNAWMYENCRNCAEPLDQTQVKSEPSHENDSFTDSGDQRVAQNAEHPNAPGGSPEAAPRSSWLPIGGPAGERRMLAVIVGILLHTVVLRLGEVIISNVVLAPNPEAVAVVGELSEPRDVPLTEDEKQQKLERLKDALPTLVGAILAFLLIAPLLTGMIVGAVFRNVVAAVWAVGLATLLIGAMAGVAGATVQLFLASLVITFLQSALGGAGATLGSRMRALWNGRIS